MRIGESLFIIGLAALLGSGCGEQLIAQGPLPPSPPNTTYRITVRKVYDANQPAALMTFARDASGTPTQGTIVGKIHGWPFPYSDLSGDSGEGLFSYRTDFIVTRATKEKQPAAAEGVRTVYFHPNRQPMSLDNLASFTPGRPIIRDAVRLSFSFEPRGTVKIAETSRQIWMHGFDWNDLRVTPPGESMHSTVVTAGYSPRYDGYLLQ
jgi:hypothetical protein